jgi:two-component system, NarL family, invasion response regulator UvrY
MGVIRVFVADDHDIVRDGLRRYIAEIPDMEVCGEGATLADALRGATGGRADVLVLDVNMPGGGGPDAVREVGACSQPPHVVVFTMFAEALYGVSFLRAGAMAFLNKQRPTRELISAIRAAAHGRRYVTSEIAEHLLRYNIDFEKPGRDLLSAREQEVVRGLADGLRATEIAASLGICPSTVHTYAQRIKEKMGVHTTVGAVQAARDEGLLG